MTGSNGATTDLFEPTTSLKALPAADADGEGTTSNDNEASQVMHRMVFAPTRDQSYDDPTTIGYEHPGIVAVPWPHG